MSELYVKWHFEQECTNELAIYKDGVKVASIVNDSDSNSAIDFINAQFIVDSCNRAETQGYLSS